MWWKANEPISRHESTLGVCGSLQRCCEPATSFQRESRGAERSERFWNKFVECLSMLEGKWKKPAFENSQSPTVLQCCALPWNEDWLLQSAVQLKLPTHSLYSLEYTSWIRAGCSAIYIYMYSNMCQAYYCWVGRLFRQPIAFTPFLQRSSHHSHQVCDVCWRYSLMEGHPPR